MNESEKKAVVTVSLMAAFADGAKHEREAAVRLAKVEKVQEERQLKRAEAQARNAENEGGRRIERRQPQAPHSAEGEKIGEEADEE